MTDGLLNVLLGQLHFQRWRHSHGSCFQSQLVEKSPSFTFQTLYCKHGLCMSAHSEDRNLIEGSPTMASTAGPQMSPGRKEKPTESKTKGC